MDDRAGFVHRSRPVFALMVKNGKIAEVAPVARRKLRGKPWLETYFWLIDEGVEVEQLGP